MRNMLSTVKATLCISAFIFLCGNFNGVSAAAGSLATGLVGEYFFNGTLTEENGGYPFSYWNGYSFTTDQDGNANSAVTLDSSHYLKMPYNYTWSMYPTGDSSRSFTFWGNLQTTSLSNSEYFIEYGENNTNQAFRFGINTAQKFEFDFYGNTINTGVAVNWNNWHHYSVTYDSSNSTIYLYVDGDLKFSQILTYNLSTVVDSYEPKFGYGIKMSAGDLMIHNRALSLAEIKGITNEDTIISGGLSGGNILPANQENYSLTLTGITDVNYDTVTFEYSFDNITYQSFSGSLAGPLTNRNFAESIDLSGLADGAVTIYAKANDGYADSNVVSMIVQKNTAVPIITTASTIDEEDIKSVKLSMSTDIGTSSQNINTTGICNNTLVFTEYAELIYDLASDNGKYICYKVDLGDGNIYYKLSEQVSGVLGKMTYGNGDVFQTYKDWRNSTQVKANDTTMAFLRMMISTNKITSTNTDTTYPSSLVDVNGDGLVDMLYTNYFSYQVVVNGYVENRNRTKYAIMVNNGDYTFTPVYRCIKDHETYYGNCADIN